MTAFQKGGRSIVPISSTFDTIHPIDMVFGTHNKLPLYFQLSVTKKIERGRGGGRRWVNLKKN